MCSCWWYCRWKNSTNMCKVKNEHCQQNIVTRAINFLFNWTRACNKHVQSFDQLLSTHVPTVWAIDQYRIYKDVRTFAFLNIVCSPVSKTLDCRYWKDRGKSLITWMFHSGYGTPSVIMTKTDVSRTVDPMWYFYVFRSLARFRCEIVGSCGIQKSGNFVQMFR